MKKVKMKNWFKVLLGSCLVLVMVTGCKKDDDDNGTTDKTIAQVVADDADYSLLEYALTKASLTATLGAEAGTFTVFAPNNAAFTAAGLGTEAAIDAVPVSDLSNILLNHVLSTEVKSSAIAVATNTPTTFLSLETNYITKKNSGEVFVNGIQVTTADVDCKNGVIHKVGAVISPALGDIVEIASANTDLSLLVAAVLHASSGATDVATVLSGVGPYTVFAPTNAAFTAAGFPTAAAIQAANPNDIAAILTYHVVSGRIFACDLTNGQTPATLNGGTVTINTTSGVTVKGNGNGANASNVTKANILADNGVVHVIDRVLLP